MVGNFNRNEEARKEGNHFESTKGRKEENRSIWEGKNGQGNLRKYKLFQLK